MGTVLDAIDDDDDDAPSSSFASRWRRRRNRLLACSKSFFFFATTTTTRRLFRSRGGRGFAGRQRRRRREECIIIIFFFFFFFFVERGSRRGSLQTDVRAERGEAHRVRDLSKADRRFFGEQQRRTSHGGREGKAARNGEEPSVASLPLRPRVQPCCKRSSSTNPYSHAWLFFRWCTFPTDSSRRNGAACET